ncbi:MAG TPA: hypothetical protein EYQ50_04470 [Verrucomicrobiales bacterium]|nr:hypothetical protein [Verrucomicrobiales bacterium]
MDKDALAGAVKLVCVNWNLPTVGPPFQDRCRLWWDFLNDVEIDLVNEAIKQLISLDQRFPPRVGQVRRLVIDMKLKDPIPSPPEAWAQLRSAIDASEAGVTFQKPHDLVGQTMRSFPNSGTALRTNSDRDLFLSAYDRIVQNAEKERYLGGSNT